MKAIVYDKSSGPLKLVLREMDKPIPKDNEVLVRIHAVSVNAADYRSMNFGIIPKRKIFGSDISGKIEVCGKNITRFKKGDDVLGDISGCGFGGFAEYVAVPERFLTLKPDEISYVQAAAVPMASVTALQALRDKGHIKPGQKVLINGSSGGVGTFAVQLATYFKAKVTAVCSERNAELAKSLGAVHVIDYAQENFTKSMIKYDLIIAVNGNESLFAYKRVLAPKGIYVMIGGAISQVARSIFFGWIMSIGSKKMSSVAAVPNIKDLDFILELMVNDHIHPVIERQYLLEETPIAVQYASKGHSRGKIVISIISDEEK